MTGESILILALRRLRTPLLILITVYAIGIMGLVLIPGVDAEGRPAHLSYFHAFYFLTYTASTIGFGEIPYAFTDTQRLWVSVVIFLAVIGWAYTLAAFLALARDRSFRLAVTTTVFGRRVRALGEPFYVVCGYGETGALVCEGLDRVGIRFVVLDIDPARIDELDLHTYHGDVAALVADAKLPENLLRAGITHPSCRGAIALTNDDEANLAVAITMKLVSPRIPVLCRATRRGIVANMASFDTDHIINPFQAFGAHLWSALHAPAMHRLTLRVTSLPGTGMPERTPPPRGHWIVCGYGRFGREVVGSFLREGLSVTIIDPEPPADERHRFVRGLGTEARTLMEAGLAQAVGVVAGTDDDVNNLSIAMTARAEKPGLFVVARQNLQANRILFDKFGADVTMVSARIIALESLARIRAPLLAPFLSLSAAQTEGWAAALEGEFQRILGDVVPMVWQVSIDHANAPALVDLSGGARGAWPLDVLLRDPSSRHERLACVALLCARGHAEVSLLPAAGSDLAPGDAILFAGTPAARSRQELTLRNTNVLKYVETGIEAPGGYVWQWLDLSRARRAGLERSSDS
ncbi:MAG: potassium channel protein [Betaproteobacteria bacterium]|nr:MAG: potassium channel protein [Betaproteobacteria bacterium]